MYTNYTAYRTVEGARSICFTQPGSENGILYQRDCLIGLAQVMNKSVVDSPLFDTVLVTKKNPGSSSKLSRAKRLGLEIISYGDYADAMGDALVHDILCNCEGIGPEGGYRIARLPDASRDDRRDQLSQAILRTPTDVLALAPHRWVGVIANRYVPLARDMRSHQVTPFMLGLNNERVTSPGGDFFRNGGLFAFVRNRARIRGHGSIVIASGTFSSMWTQVKDILAGNCVNVAWSTPNWAHQFAGFPERMAEANEALLQTPIVIEEPAAPVEAVYQFKTRRVPRCID